MGYSTPKKQLDLKEFLSQPATKKSSRSGMTFRRPGSQATGSTAAAEPPPAPDDDAATE